MLVVMTVNGRACPSCRVAQPRILPAAAVVPVLPELPVPELAEQGLVMLLPGLLPASLLLPTVLTASRPRPPCCQHILLDSSLADHKIQVVLQ